MAALAGDRLVNRQRREARSMVNWQDLNSADRLIEAFEMVCRPGASDVGAAVDFIFQCQVSPGSLTDFQKACLTATAASFLERPQSWAATMPACIMLASAIVRYGDSRFGCRALKKAFDLSRDRKARNELFFTVNGFAFKYGVDVGFDLPDMFFAQVDDWFRFLKAPDFEPLPGRCVIAMPQFLMPPHQPTSDAIAKYGLLRDRFGFDVAIINTAERPKQFDLPIVDAMPTGRLKEFNGLQNAIDNFDVPNIQIFTPPQAMPSLEGYIAILEFIETWRPEFILNFGAFHLAGELLARGVKTITMPAGTELLPTRASAFDVAFHPVSESDRAMIQRYGMEPVKVIEAAYNFDLPAPVRTYTREDFGLSPEDFAIAVVGVRLNDELHADNARMLARICALDPRIVFVFAGPLAPATPDFLCSVMPAHRLRFPGRVEDVPAMYAHMNLYVNPKRIGGGASAVFAMAKGVPAFTLRHGHVADMIVPDFVFDTEEALLAAVKDAFQPQRYAELQAIARAGFDRVNSRERMLEHILNEAGIRPRGEAQSVAA